MPTVALLCLPVFEFGRGVGFYCEVNWLVLGVERTALKDADTKIPALLSQGAMSGSAH